MTITKISYLKGDIFPWLKNQSKIILKDIQ